MSDFMNPCNFLTSLTCDSGDVYTGSYFIVSIILEYSVHFVMFDEVIQLFFSISIALHHCLADPKKMCIYVCATILGVCVWSSLGSD